MKYAALNSSHNDLTALHDSFQLRSLNFIINLEDDWEFRTSFAYSYKYCRARRQSLHLRKSVILFHEKQLSTFLTTTSTLLLLESQANGSFFHQPTYRSVG